MSSKEQRKYKEKYVLNAKREAIMSRKKKRNKLNDWHHRRPTSRGGKNTEENLVQVNKGKHESWHHIFKNYHPEIVCDIINRVWLDPSHKFVCLPRKS